MRRGEIVDVLIDSIGQHFPDDVADVFDKSDLDNVGRMLQDRDADTERQIDGLVQIVASNASGRELDQLADGAMDSPIGWLYNKLRDA
jgi:hypothetical protein